MTKSNYAQIYTEVLEVLRHLPEIQYNKIPKERIEFYENNCDTLYNFELEKDLKNLSPKANAIIVSIYKDYFTTPKQKETLHNILVDNERKAEELRKEKYNPDEIFKNNKIIKEKIDKEQENINTQIIEYKKENILRKFLNRLKLIFYKKKNN